MTTIAQQITEAQLDKLKKIIKKIIEKHCI